MFPRRFFCSDHSTPLLNATLLVLSSPTAASSVGVCYGRVANNLLPPSDVVNIIKSNGILKVRLFDADPTALQAFSGTGIELMIGVSNEILPELASGGPDAANQWLQSNLFDHIPAAQIQYLAVGNEILHQALQTLNLAEKSCCGERDSPPSVAATASLGCSFHPSDLLAPPPPPLPPPPLSPFALLQLLWFICRGSHSISPRHPPPQLPSQLPPPPSALCLPTFHQMHCVPPPSLLPPPLLCAPPPYRRCPHPSSSCAKSLRSS